MRDAALPGAADAVRRTGSLTRVVRARISLRAACITAADAVVRAGGFAHVAGAGFASRAAGEAAGGLPIRARAGCSLAGCTVRAAFAAARSAVRFRTGLGAGVLVANLPGLAARAVAQDGAVGAPADVGDALLPGGAAVPQTSGAAVRADARRAVARFVGAAAGIGGAAGERAVFAADFVSLGPSLRRRAAAVRALPRNAAFPVRAGT